MVQKERQQNLYRTLLTILKKNIIGAKVGQTSAPRSLFTWIPFGNLLHIVSVRGWKD
jgi:hypothetical protein